MEHGGLGLREHVVALLANEQGKKLIREKCQEAGFDIGIFEALVDAELDQVGKMRRAGLWDDFESILADLTDLPDVPDQDRS